jgi:hypothetical protein
MGNRNNIVLDLEDYLNGLKDIRNSIAHGDKVKLRKLLWRAKRKRDMLSKVASSPPSSRLRRAGK